MFMTLMSASIPSQHTPYFLSRRVHCLSFPKHAHHVHSHLCTWFMYHLRVSP